ncbi:MAG: hypothetical protein DRP30_03555 [Thermotoga sp.]|nr:MAG: hypothetical protein DRP30_03555 [Thermotoga sp.]
MIEKFLDNLPYELRTALSPIKLEIVEEGDAPAWITCENGRITLKLSEIEFMKLTVNAKCPAQKVLEIVITHELYHIYFSHLNNLFSGENHNQFLMNVALDAVINRFIPGISRCFQTFDPLGNRWNGVPLTKKNLSAEDLYSLLNKPDWPNVLSFDKHTPVKFPHDEELKEFVEGVIEKLTGRKPAGMLRKIKMKSENCWVNKILMKIMEIQYRYTNRRPSRRHEIFPGKKLSHCRNLTLMIDSSSSLSEETLSKVLKLAGDLIYLVEDLSIYSYDVKAYKLTKVSLRNGELIGGGGTSLESALNDVRLKGPLIVITDGLDEFPNDIPKDSYVVVVGNGVDFYKRAIEKLGRRRVFREEGI